MFWRTTRKKIAGKKAANIGNQKYVSEVPKLDPRIPTIPHWSTLNTNNAKKVQSSYKYNMYLKHNMYLRPLCDINFSKVAKLKYIYFWHFLRIIWISVIVSPTTLSPMSVYHHPVVYDLLRELLFMNPWETHQQSFELSSPTILGRFRVVSVSTTTI